MKSVFVCTLVLALAHHAFAGVCDSNVDYNSTLITPCLGNDIIVLWPNYLNFNTYYKCVEFGKPQLMDCPPNTYFTYYFQQCTGCDNFIPAPTCEYLSQTTDVECVPLVKPTTAAPTTLKTTPSKTTPIVTTAPPSTPVSSTPATNKPDPTTPKTTKPPKVTTTVNPSPPTGTGPATNAPSSDIPLPPIASTVNTKYPTPPGMPPTPPSFGTPPSIVQPKN